MKVGTSAVGVGYHRSFLVAMAFLFVVSSCAQRHRHPPPVQSMSEQQKLQLIRQLKAAAESDESEARDPQVSLLRKEDFFEQAAKADRAVRELIYGYDVPQPELADALSVPPKALSPRQKGDLIRQLEDTIALNDRREQARLNDYWNAYVDTEPYDMQKERAAAVIKELTIGEEVHWDTIQEALQVPSN
jgi:hypothetical protein